MSIIAFSSYKNSFIKNPSSTWNSPRHLQRISQQSSTKIPNHVEFNSSEGRKRVLVALTGRE